MAIETKKFSEFTDGGDLEPDQTTVGLEGGGNVSFNNPMPNLEPGSTGDRPAADPSMYYRLRFNTTLESYEYYSPTQVAWIQIEDSTDIATLLALLASHANGEGASLIGLENQTGVSNKTVQDLAESSIVVNVDNGTLTNAQSLSALSNGYVSVANTTGVLSSHQFSGTANQIDLTNTDGSGNPVWSVSSTFNAPGTLTVQGTVAIDSIIDDDTMATASDTNIPTSESVVAYIASTPGGAGGSNTQLQYNNAGTLDGISTLTYNGTNVTSTRGATIDGSSDEVQLTVQGHSTQTSNILEIQNSAGTNLLTFDNSGVGAVTGQWDVDSLRLDGNTLSSTISMNFEGGSSEYVFNGISGSAAEIRLREDSANGNMYVSWIAPASISASYGFTLPSSAPSSNDQVMKFTTGGVASYATVSEVTTPTVDQTIARFDGTSGALEDSGVTINDSDVVSGVTQLNVDNLRLDGNSITSTNAAGDINITPDTTGDLVLDGQKWPQADGATDAVLETNGAGQTSWQGSTGTGNIVRETSATLITPTSLGVQQQALDMGTQLINNVVDPASAQDAATKNYVDNTPGAAGGSNTQLQYNNSGTLDGISTLTYNGTNVTATRGWIIDGISDEIQLKIQGHSTQTSNILEVENSAASSLFTVDNNGNFEIVDGAVFKVNGDEIFQFDETGTGPPVAHLSVKNSAGENPSIRAMSDDPNSNVSVEPKGNAAFRVFGNTTVAAAIQLTELSSNGTAHISLKAPDSIAANFTLIFPNALPAANNSAILFDTSGTGSFGVVSTVTTPTTDNAIARFDGTSGALEDSGVTINDSDVVSGVTQLNVDNLRLDGNSITSTNAAGDINITPDTTGSVVIDGLSYPQADGTANQHLKTNGANQIGFTTATYADTYSASELLYSNGANTVEGLTTANNATLITSAAGVPSISQTLPTAVQGNITQLGTQSQAVDMGSNLINNVSIPTSSTDAATKGYVDGIAFNTHPAANFATTANLAGYTYDNGASGVGATLTAGSNGAFSTDGQSPSLNDRILVKDQSTGAQNGPYTLTQVGDGSNPAILTRATDYDESSDMEAGDEIAVVGGDTLAGSKWMMTQTAAITVGTTDITWIDIAIPENIVTIAGTQTITGDKTFNNLLTINDPSSSGSSANPRIDFADSAGTRLGYFGYGSVSTDQFFILNDTASGSITFRTNGNNERLEIGNSDSIFATNLGIQTSTPTARLQVKASSDLTSDFPFSILNNAETVNTGYGAYGINQNASSDYTIDVNSKLIFDISGTEKADITTSGLRLGAANARVTTILDEDDMASDSATALTTQQAAKAYADTKIAAVSSTDNALARFDGASGALQNSGATLDDSDNLQLSSISFDSGINTLSQYETDSWTPTFNFSTTGDLSVSYSTRIGSYTRIGNIVIVECTLIFTPTFSTSSGESIIQNLPFSATDNASLCVSNKSSNITFVSSDTMIIAAIPGGATVKLRSTSTNSGASDLTTSEFTSGASHTIVFGGSYLI